MINKTSIESGGFYKIIEIIHSKQPYDYNIKLKHDDMIGNLEGSLATILKELGKKYNDKQIVWLMAHGYWSIDIK